MEYEKGISVLKQAAANDSAHGRLRPSSVRGAARSAQACLFFFFADWRLAAQLGRIWPTSMPPIGAGTEQAATWASSRKAAQGALPPGLYPAQQPRAVRSAAAAIGRWSVQIGGIKPPAPGPLSKTLVHFLLLPAFLLPDGGGSQ